MYRVILLIILALSLLTLYLVKVKGVDIVEPVAPDAVVPLDYDSNEPAGHTGEPASPDQPQPVYPPMVVPPICDCDGPTGAVGEPPGANQPSPVYPPEPVLSPPLPPEKPSEARSDSKAKASHQRAKPRVVKRIKRNLKKRLDRRRQMVYTGKRIEPKPSPFYPTKYWKR